MVEEKKDKEETPEDPETPEEETPEEEGDDPKKEVKKKEVPEEPESRHPQSKEVKRTWFDKRKKDEFNALKDENARLKADREADGIDPLPNPTSITPPDEGGDYVSRDEFERKMKKFEDEKASEGLLQGFLSENPEYAPYEMKIRKYMNHDDYLNASIGFIARGVAGGNVSIDPEAKEKADKEAKETVSGGHPLRKSHSKFPNFREMTSEEFGKYQEDILSKPRD